MADGAPDRLHGGELNDNERDPKSCTEGSSRDGEMRNVRSDRREDEPAPYRLFEACGGRGSLHEMPCKGTFETAGYCGLCSLREDIRGEGPQETGENMQPGMPCRVWTNLRDEAMGHFWDNGEPAIDRVTDGVPNRADRIKCLGNAVVPQQFYPFFRAIYLIETGDPGDIRDYL